MGREWDATTYDRVSDPQFRWGLEVLERLPLAGDETVLDAGCGSGRVTEALLERLPNGRVIALDASAAMLDAARERLARFAPRVDFVLADLGEPLPIEPVEAIISTATFHWVPDHDALFANLAGVLEPGGRLVAQCGGAGNVACFEEAVARLVPHVRGTHRFETAEATAGRLRLAGFEDVTTSLSARPTRFEPGAPFEDFLETVCMRRILEGIDPADRAELIHDVAAELGEPTLDYVRLDMSARRGDRR